MKVKNRNTGLTKLYIDHKTLETFFQRRGNI